MRFTKELADISGGCKCECVDADHLLSHVDIQNPARLVFGNPSMHGLFPNEHSLLISDPILILLLLQWQSLGINLHSH